jgi:cystathionine gamma-synthase
VAVRADSAHAVAFASGQAAVAALLAPLSAGTVVTLADGSYLGTRGLLQDLDGSGRIRLRLTDVTDTGAVRASLPGTDLLWLESPTNPLLGIADLPRIVPPSGPDFATSSATVARPSAERMSSVTERLPLFRPVQ